MENRRAESDWNRQFEIFKTMATNFSKPLIRQKLGTKTEWQFEESEAGKGSTFTVLIPVKAALADELAVAKPVPNPHAKPTSVSDRSPTDRPAKGTRIENDRVRRVKTGGIDFLSKPIVPELLEGKVKIFLDLYRGKVAMRREIEKRKVSEAALEKLKTQLEEANENLEKKVD